MFLALNVADRSQPGSQSLNVTRDRSRRQRVEHADEWHALLSRGRDWPRYHRTAEQRDELASFQLSSLLAKSNSTTPGCGLCCFAMRQI
jgi:hypothetical protein